MTTCSTCGAQGVPILYGMPSGEGFEAYNRGELILGGCCIEPGQATEACPRCDTRWGSQELAVIPTTSPWDDIDLSGRGAYSPANVDRRLRHVLATRRGCLGTR